MSMPRGHDAYAANQGIVDGRPEGQNPPSAPIQLDTYIDRDASALPTEQGVSAESTLVGATSRDMRDSTGAPGSGMTSQEIHHDGRHGRKRNPYGLDPHGNPGKKERVLAREERDREKAERRLGEDI